MYTLANELGFFSFRDVDPGAFVLTVTRIGFREHREQVSVEAGATEVEVVMTTEAIVVAGITVEAERSRAKTRFEESAGITVQEIEAAALKSLPVIAEADPLRAIEVLPGVTTVSDFSAAFNVRGGSADQNLILLDEVPIFNPFHLGGIFSVFNADMVDRVELQSGGFGAEYGGRVSSVLTIASDPGDGDFGVDAGVSILATRVAVNGALPRGAAEKLGFTTTRWRGSARRSYLDVLFKPWVDFPYHLSDLSGRLRGVDAGDTEATLSPRFAVRHFLRDRNSAVRLSAGRYSQFIHSTRDEEFPFGIDTWVLAGAEAPRVVSDQCRWVGAETFFGDDDDWFASLEGYYRTFDGVASINSADDPNDDTDALVAGDGNPYGVDLYVKRERGTTTGWISISFLKTVRSFPDTRVGIEPRPWITYSPVFDRRLEIDLALRRPLDW